MKNCRRAIFLGMAVMVLPLAVHAQGRIGVINMTQAIGSTAEGKKAIAELDQKFAPRKQELEQLQRQIQEIQAQLGRQSPTLSDDEQRRLQRDLEEKQRILKRSADDAQSDYNADTEETVRRIGKKMVSIIAEYAPSQGFVLILDNAQLPIYYAAKTVNIQDEIVKRYDAANPAAGTAAAAAPKPPAH